MRIVTWTDELDDYTHTERPKTLRLSPQEVSAKPGSGTDAALAGKQPTPAATDQISDDDIPF